MSSDLTRLLVFTLQVLLYIHHMRKNQPSVSSGERGTDGSVMADSQRSSQKTERTRAEENNVEEEGDYHACWWWSSLMEERL